MNPLWLACPKCGVQLTTEVVNRADLAPCPGCSARLQAEIYPALFRPVARGRDGESVIIENEASCFYHPQKRAVVPCEACGRFLCALCDCELHGEHFCPACLEAGGKKGKIKRLENQRTLYDSIALSLAVLPVAVVFGIYFTIITAPAAIYVAIRHWNAPLGMVRRTKVRYTIAIVLALLQIVGWGVGIYLFSTSFHSNG